jgi:2-polyprenyl-3-methyl-5-hydroxy-6-metoxy-1,4-benzoquinol methylase
MKISIKHGMILKDATPFNIQFIGCKPIWIDTLSFEDYNEKQPWVAYRQFCECFLGPIAVMSYINTSLQKLLMLYPAGIPLKLIAKMLPLSSRMNGGLLMHLFFQSALTEKKSDTNEKYKSSFSKQKLSAIIDSLERTIQKLHPKNTVSVWSNYYSETVLGENYVKEKEGIVRKMLSVITSKKILDIGANNGFFSKIAEGFSDHVIAMDADEKSINRLFIEANAKETKLDVVVADIAFPSPSLGALLEERQDLLQRLKVDTLLALAVLHHLVITSQFTMTMAAELFSSLADHVIIELPLPEDEKVKFISRNIEKLETRYSLILFSVAFDKYFEVIAEKKLATAERIIFLLKKRRSCS